MKTILSLLSAACMIFILFTNCNSSKTAVVGQGDKTGYAEATKKQEQQENQLSEKAAELIKLRNASPKSVEMKIENPVEITK